MAKKKPSKKSNLKQKKECFNWRKTNHYTKGCCGFMSNEKKAKKSTKEAKRNW